MKRLVTSLVLLVLLTTRAWAAPVTCTITGVLTDALGNPVPFGVLQFNSLITQVLPNGPIPQSFVSATADANGNIVIAIQQGLQGQFTFCAANGGTCGASTPGLIPISMSALLSNVLVGNELASGATLVANLSVSNNLTVGGTLQVSGATTLTSLNATGNVSVGGALSLSGNLTVPGTFGVTGTSTLGTVNTSGTIAAPSLTLTQTTPSLVLPSGIITTNNTPISGQTGGFATLFSAGAHVTPTGSWIADSPNAEIFNLNGNDGNSTGAHDWYLNTGLTVGNQFTPTAAMNLTPVPQSGVIGITSTTSELYVGNLTLTNNLGTALTFGGGSIVSANNPNLNLAAGAHWNGVSWVADAPAAEIFSEAPSGPGFVWQGNSGLTVGNPYVTTALMSLTTNGLLVNGTNPVEILQSNTNLNSDIIETFPQNQTQGIGIGWNEIHSIGSNPAIGMDIDGKGGGDLGLNNNNPTGRVILSGHFIHILNGAPVPSVSGTSLNCGVGASVVGGSTDTFGSVTVGSGSGSSCVVNFGQAFASPPGCFIQNAGTPTTATWAYSANTSSFTVNFFNNAGMQNFIWWCPSHS